MNVSPDESRITHVSDTALLTAAIRALETDRADGLIQDRFAARLAGERGMAIAHAFPLLEVMCFGVGMRSRLLDDLLAVVLTRDRIATILSVGAGLDTRPWRLDLPSDLVWIEVDLPEILEYKAAILDSEKPSCRVERMVVDLNDPTPRRAMLESASWPALMITEGLLMYLPAPTVDALAADTLASTRVKHWLLDLATGELARSIRMDSCQDIEAVRAPDRLDAEQIVNVLERAGWNLADSRTYATHVTELIPRPRLERMARGLAAARGSEPPQPPPSTDISGVHLFIRS